MKYNNTGICPICKSETKIVTYSCTYGTEEEYEDCDCGYHREYVYGGKGISFQKKDGSIIEYEDGKWDKFYEECKRDYEKNN